MYTILTYLDISQWSFHKLLIDRQKYREAYCLFFGIWYKHQQTVVVLAVDRYLCGYKTNKKSLERKRNINKE